MKKESITKQVSELEIFYKFLNISAHPDGNISSPFSEDKKPSFKLYKNGSFKCNSTGKQGDCWQFVADLKELDCKADFAKVLEIIASEFNISSENSHFEYKTKPYEQQHLEYFIQGNWNVTKSELEEYKVKALDKFEFYNSKKKEIEKKKIFEGIAGFVYELNSKAEIYIPKQNKANKFLLNKTTASDIFGLEQLKKYQDIIIISAGKKDCLILNSNSFKSVCFRSENHYPNAIQIKTLKDKCKHLLVCYDTDESGKKAAANISSKHKIPQLILPKNYNDIADYFMINTSDQLNEIIKETLEVTTAKEENETAQTIFHQTENYLTKFYKFRYNEIGLDIEYCKKGNSDWESFNENSMFIELQKKNIKCSMNNLLAIVKSDFVGKYNPIKNYFDNLPAWDKKTDYISILANYVTALDQEQFTYHFKKWCVRTVKCAVNSDYFNKQAFVLVHKGQNTGKSTFCRFLVPQELKNYLAEDISQDKDARILLCKNLIINLDELAGLNRKELASLKSIFSKTQVNERLPYDRKNSIIQRICSFIGSTNEDNFLNDTTGSVRWLCFQISGIDWKYKEQFNIANLWSQAVSLANDENFDAEMNRKDIEENEIRNSKFQQLSTEQEIIARYFKKSDENHGEFMTSTDVILYLNPLSVRLNKIQVGKALSALNFERIKDKKRQVYGYYLIPLSLIDEETPKSFSDALNKNLQPK